jgi:hypothetical protein
MPARSGPFASISRFFSRIGTPRIGRQSAKASRLSRAVRCGVERLEERLQFTIIGPGDGVLEYYDGAKNTVRIAWHDMTAQLLFATVDPKTDLASESDLIPPAVPAPTNGAYLYTIYVMQSNLDSWMSIGQVPAIDAKGARTMNPFGGSAGPFSVVNAQGGKNIAFSPPGDSGAILLGAKHVGVANSGFGVGEPIINLPFVPGLVPGPYNPPTGFLQPGLYVSPVALDATGAAIIGADASFPTLETPNDIGEFFFGGTIIGNVDIPAAPAGTVPPSPASQGGNVGTFYAGTILTGDAGGTFEGFGESASSQTANFAVGGDIRDLITSGPIGGDPVGGTIEKPQYVTGTYITVGGTVGELYQREGGFLATYAVSHDPSVPPLTDQLLPEIQYQFHPEDNEAAGDVFQGGLIADPTSLTGATLTPRLPQPFNIDNAATPQYLGSIAPADPTTGVPLTDAAGNFEYEAQVTGILQASVKESSNYYSIPLLAGQTIQISAQTQQELQVQLIDPDGRIVASDENRLKPSVTLDVPFQYTPDRPGEYSILVTAPPGEILPLEDFAYSLTVDGVGDMGLGTLSSAGSISDTGFDEGFLVSNGDLGAMLAGANLTSFTDGPSLDETTTTTTTTVPPSSITALTGNIRTLKAASIGFEGNLIDGIPYIDAPLGTVGLVDATDAGGVLAIQTRWSLTAVTPTPFSAVGGDFQLINGAGTVDLDIATNQAIGVIRAGNMSTEPASYIDVNADNTGKDGIIDLIDCTGNFGDELDGGPGIVTHDGGDVRYIRVGGQVFENSNYGGGVPSDVRYQIGEAATITDDSGSTLTFTPTGSTTTTITTGGTVTGTVTTTNPTLGTEITTGADGTVTTVVGPQLDLQTYGILDKGGVVVINATSSQSMTIAANGTNGSSSVAEVGQVNITGNGEPVIPAVDPQTGLPVFDSNGEQELAIEVPVTTTTTTGGTTTGSTTGTTTGGTTTGGTTTVGTTTPTTTTTTVGGTTTPTLTLLVQGSATCDVLEVNAAGEDVTSIENNTAGEITTVLAATIGTLFGNGAIGIAKSSTPEAVNPSEVLADGNTYPWNGQSIGIEATGDVMTIESNQAVGNIFVHGDLGAVVANMGGKPTPGTFAGIDGPVTATGRILQAHIGQGLLPTGTGNVGFSGIFAVGDIGTVTNDNRTESDIRGNIVSQTVIDNVALGNGSIINCGLFVTDDFVQTQAIAPTGFTSPQIPSTITNPNFELKKVTVNGRGGIIGANFVAADIGPVSVSKQGFGLLECDFTAVGNGVVGAITAGGYGIRSTNFFGGAAMQSINATGNGSQLSVASFPADLRQSESTDDFDQFFGLAPSSLTDLDEFLGTTVNTPEISDVTDTGVIEDVIASGSSYVSSITAQKIRVSTPLVLAAEEGATPTDNIPVPGVTFGTSFNFANSIGSINVRGTIDGLQVTTGRLGSFTQHGGVSRMGIAVAGTIKNLTIHGNFGQIITSLTTGQPIPDSYITATGIDGTIKNLNITGALNGNVTATGSIGNVTVGGSLNGSLVAQGDATKLPALNYLRVNGSIANGGLTINGNAGTIIANGSLGVSTDTLTVAGSVQTVNVGAGHRKGSSLGLTLNVEGKLHNLIVYGRIDGSVTVASDLGNMQVTGDGTTANIVNGNILVGGRIGSVHISNGNLNANVTSSGMINSVTLSKGSLTALHTVQSTIEGINNFKVTGGKQFGVFGSIIAANGAKGNINISGSFGDGVDAASISAFSGNDYVIGGSMLSGSSITLSDILNLLHVKGNIEAGASVTAHPLKKLIVGGQNLGTITGM